MLWFAWFFGCVCVGQTSPTLGRLPWSLKLSCLRGWLSFLRSFEAYLRHAQHTWQSTSPHATKNNTQKAAGRACYLSGKWRKQTCRVGGQHAITHRSINKWSYHILSVHCAWLLGCHLRRCWVNLEVDTQLWQHISHFSRSILANQRLEFLKIKNFKRELPGIVLIPNYVYLNKKGLNVIEN